MKALKRILSLLLVAVMIAMTFSGCGNDDYDIDSEATDNTQIGDEENNYDTTEFDDEPAESWAIYWYLCGSDLETNYGAATSDLEEMMSVTLPDNVNIVIETGGASVWNNEIVNPQVRGRYLYNSEGLQQVDEQPVANMGSPDTLADFLTFCNDNYQADNKMVLFWNHGGGSVSGAAFDELFENDSLTLDEMNQAFSQVFGTEEKSLEVVGFDTCLMATIDTAKTFTSFSNYLVASEELEPGCGWDYSGWVQALADDPTMNGDALGKVICDTFAEGCEMQEVADEITLSVTDLRKIKPLLSAYDNLGIEALSLACEDPLFFSEFGRSASRSESYGGNTPDQGYTNMVDLGHLVRNSEELLSKNAQDVLKGLEDCIVYKINGPYREEATGLSCYYSYNGDAEDFNGFANVGASDSFKYLYEYELTGELSENGMTYINDIGYNEISEVPTVEKDSLEDYPLEIDENGNAVLNLGADIADKLKSVYFNLFYFSEEDDIIISLGRDNDIETDWDAGIFKDNFRGVWGSIDGELCYMEIVYEGDDYNLYSIPILLNGEEYNLRVVYSFTDEAFKILGARKGLDDTGMADKNLTILKAGDKVTPINYVMTISSEDDDLTSFEGNTITITENTSFAEADLGDGKFMLMFEMVDAANESFLSNPAIFTVEGDDIYTETE